MRRFYTLFTLLCLALFLKAQIVTTTPEFPVPGGVVSVVFDATQGNKGLMGYTGDVYAPTGVITNLSTGDKDWRYAPDWGDNSEKYKMKSLGNNKWQLDITPDIRTYYNISDGEIIKKMAFVFRSGDKSKEGKGEGGTDIFVAVYADGISVRMDEPVDDVVSVGENVSMKATASVVSSMKLYLNDKVVASKDNAKEISCSYTFSDPGNYVLKAEATADGKTATDTRTLSVLGGSVEEKLPEGVQAGANYINDTEVTLVLFAPKKSTVHVKGDFTDWKISKDYQMKKDGDNFWITLKNLEPQKEYFFQYVVDGAIIVADPYSEKISDVYDQYITEDTYPGLADYPTGKTEGPVTVIQTGQKKYEWEIKNFKSVDRSNLVIYEMLFRDFTDSSNINGALEKLDYLKGLGVTAVELMPCQEFSGNDSWGYNPNFYFAMDKAYGTTDMYKQFIDECHKRGLAVILDVVYNQADQEMPYVKMYFDGTNPTKDNPFFNVTAPHPYSVFYDFNHESEYTKAFVKRNLKFLLEEFNLDGFRFDLTKGFTNKQSSESTAGNFDQSRIDILKGYNAAVKAVNPNAYVILEHFCAVSEENVLAEDGMMLWRNMNSAFRESAKGNAADFSGLYADGQSMPKESLVGFMESHDEERMGYMTGLSLTPRLKQLVCNAAFALVVPGPKMIWQFGEMGYDVSIEYNGRTGKKPTHWEYLEDSKRKVLYDTYCKLLALRQSYPDLFTSSVALTMKVGTDNWSNRYLMLSKDDKHIVLVGNLGKSASDDSYQFPVAGTWYNLMDESTIEVSSATAQVPLSAHEFRLYTNFKPVLTGVEENIAALEQFSAYYDQQRDELVIDGEAARVEIFTISGMMVQRQDNVSILGLSVLPSGNYIARIVMNDGAVSSCKIIK